MTISILICMMFVWGVQIVLGGGNRFWIATTGGGYLFDYGYLNYTAVFKQHQWYRLLTNGYLHNGILHLVANGFALLHVADLLRMKITEMEQFLLLNFGIVLSSFFGIMFLPYDSGVGASGGIFVLIGLLIFEMIFDLRFAYDVKQKKLAFRYIVIYMLAGIALGKYTITIHSIGCAIGGMYGILRRVLLKDRRNKNI